MVKFISFIFCTLLVVANLWIVQNTKKKIAQYNQNPPFLKFDFTNSDRKNPASRISHLFDKNKDSFWKKEQPAPLWDLDLELKLTHILQNGVYVPRKFSQIVLENCGEKKEKLRWEIYLREAINVDKELRLPQDKILLTGVWKTFRDKQTISIPKISLKPTKEYDAKEISILGIRIQSQNIGTCISEIALQ